MAELHPPPTAEQGPDGSVLRSHLMEEENIMAARDGGGATPLLAFLVGGLVVVVAVIAYFMYTGNSAPTKQLDVNIKAPAAPSAPATPSGG
jgi:hypothetical protein